jgi:hypothetical protein
MNSILDFQSKGKQQNLIPDFDFKALKISAGELADLLGLTTQRIGQLRRDGIIPPPSDGFFNLKEAIGGYVTFLKNSQGRLEGNDKDRLTKLQADKVQLDLQKRSGELIPRSEVEARDFRKGRVIRDILLSIGPRCGPLVAPESDPFRCSSVIDKEIRDLLLEVSDE